MLMNFSDLHLAIENLKEGFQVAPLAMVGKEKGCTNLMKGKRHIWFHLSLEARGNLITNKGRTWSGSVAPAAETDESCFRNQGLRKESGTMLITCADQESWIASGINPTQSSLRQKGETFDDTTESLRFSHRSSRGFCNLSLFCAGNFCECLSLETTWDD